MVHKDRTGDAMAPPYAPVRKLAATDQVDAFDCAAERGAERIRKDMGQYPIPVVILARLAVSLQAPGLP